MATVTYDHATRFYPGSDNPAVDRLSLDIGDGEFMVLVGPSGSGKSTALRMLAGLEDIDDGTVPCLAGKPRSWRRRRRASAWRRPPHRRPPRTDPRGAPFVQAVRQLDCRREGRIAP
jgi:ABC-type Fe3+/spermidine/putrescine transport system ATPase subunit